MASKYDELPVALIELNIDLRFSVGARYEFIAQRKIHHAALAVAWVLIAPEGG